MDVTSEINNQILIVGTIKECQNIAIWINTVGVNQPNKLVPSSEKTIIDRLINIDTKETCLCIKLIMPIMIK